MSIRDIRVRPASPSASWPQGRFGRGKSASALNLDMVSVEEVRRPAGKWGDWQPFPNPAAMGYLHAPFGPGVYELRHRSSGHLILYGKSKNVSHRMSSLLPAPLGAGTRKNESKSLYVHTHLSDIDYRTMACADDDWATIEEALLMIDKDLYIFRLRWLKMRRRCRCPYRSRGSRIPVLGGLYGLR